MATTILIPPAGNALRLIVTPPADATYWCVLRRADQIPTGPTDAAAVVVRAMSVEQEVLDVCGLQNGQFYYYGIFYGAAGAWTGEVDTPSAVPAIGYQGAGPDPLSIMRDRLEAGFANEIALGYLTPSSGELAVHTAPFWLRDGFAFPGCSVHLNSSAPAEHVVGQELLEPTLNPDLTSTESTGWIARTVLDVVAMSLNGDERLDIRKSLTRILQVNTTLFEELGLFDIEVAQSDTEQFAENQAPLFVTTAQLTCFHLSGVAVTRPTYSSLSLSISLP